MRRTMLKTSNNDRFRASALFLVTLAASLLLAPGVASAWEVDLSIKGAGRVTETTDANLVGEDCLPGGSSGLEAPYYWLYIGGKDGAECSPGSPDGAYGQGWIVRYVAEAQPGYRFVRWQSNGSTSTPPALCDGSNLSDIYTGSGCQFQIWRNLQIEAVFVDDTAPSAPRFVSWPTQPVNGPTRFEWEVDPDPTAKWYIECRVSGVHDWQQCDGLEDPPESGTYTVEARRWDYSNNVSPVVSRQWTVDKTAPKVIDPVSPSGRRVSRTANVVTTFSEVMDEASVEAKNPASGKPTSFTLKKKGSNTAISATIDYDSVTKTATLDPSVKLRSGATYIATISTAAKDSAGNSLDQDPNTPDKEPKTWSFRVR